MSPAHKRRWFTFSLRTLFVLVTVAAGVAGLFAWQRHRRMERIMLLSTPGVSYKGDLWDSNLGLDNVREIDVGPSVPDEVVEKMKLAFPEAEVRRGSGLSLPHFINVNPAK
jgi:hypothetical protein